MATGFEVQIEKVVMQNRQMWLSLWHEKRYAGTLHVVDEGFIREFLERKPGKMVLKGAEDL
jgi:hypothetical protein